MRNLDDISLGDILNLGDFLFEHPGIGDSENTRKVTCDGDQREEYECLREMVPDGIPNYFAVQCALGEWFFD